MSYQNKIQIKNYLLVLNLLTMLIISSCSPNGDGGVQNVIDTIAPTQPTNLTATNISQTSLQLSWNPSTDNVSVSSYSVFMNNNALVSSVSTTAIVNGLTQKTPYSFKVRAIDGAGNESLFSNSIDIITKADNSTLKTASGNLETYIGNIIDSAPGSSGNDYTEPLKTQLNSWETTVSNILKNNITEAVISAGSIGYQITEFTDTALNTSQVFYILEKKATENNFWGTYVFSKTPSRKNLILMAPHSKYDTNTGKQAAYCFRDGLAKALLINGTHRCNSSSASSCSGTTSVCGSNAAYRISDLAHTTNSAFQKTTEILFTNVVNSTFIQLHGFSKQSTDPYVIISNGTRETPTTDYATKIKNALLAEDSSLTFKLAHIDTNWNRLIGLTNTQGRLINNSTDFCNSSATTSSGRFIHIEQEKSKLRNDVSGWAKMSNALKKVF